MTRDIVAFFSCSLYTNTDLQAGNIPTGKSVGDFKEYHVVSGSTFLEEYNETLHSASILLDHVHSLDRLQLRPKVRYEFVKVFDKNPANVNNPFVRYYIVDNYVEKETNIDEHIFQYTIQLISETKILEKIQCPNLAITHKVNKDGSLTKKPIYQYIEQYMSLFIPKFKFTNDGVNWDYEPLIKMPTGQALIDFRNRFSQLCADMPLTAPTMRQLLTTLMQQVGCIPTVVNRTLGFLDFQVAALPFGGEKGYNINHTVNYIQKSCSSDSVANNLIKISENVLDNSNKVIVETLGFRDIKNAFLKQTENLKLETSFPIYKIEKVNMKTVASIDNLTMHSADDNSNKVNMWEVQDYTADGDVTFNVGYSIYSQEIFTNATTGEKGVKIILKSEFPSSPQGIRIFAVNPPFSYPAINFWGRCYFYKSDATQQENEALTNAYTDVADFELVMKDSVSGTNHLVTVEIYPNGDVDFDGYYFVGVANMTCRTRTSTTGIYRDYVNVKHFFAFANSFSISNTNFLVNLDVSPLFVESSVRNTLENNFIKMKDVNTLAGYEINGVYHPGLADYRYGTFEYSIGSKEIFGFSETFTEGSATMFGWLKQNYTYVENVFTFLLTKLKSKFFDNFFEQFFSDIYRLSNEYIDFLAVSYGMTADLVEAVKTSSMSITGLKYANIFNEHVNSNPAMQAFYNTLVTYGQIQNSELHPTADGNFDDGIYPGFIYDSGSTIAAAIANTIFSSGINFGFLFFDIEYQPLNSFNLAYTTNEDVPFAIEQYDGSADAVSDFDRLSISTQEKVDRIGNEVLTINQRTEDPGDIQNIPSYYQDDFDRDGMIDEDDIEPIKYIIFKKQFSIKNYHFDVVYTGSKDSILKNYFTSIRTKYRAYQYVDYNASVLRKERDTIYVCISEKGFFNGDNKVMLGNSLEERMKGNQLFILGCVGYDSQYANLKPLVSAVEVSTNDENQIQYVKNDISVVATNNMMAVIYEDRDNVGAGPFISIGQIARGGWYGGILQDYQIWNEEDFNEKHQIFYVNNLNYEKFFDKLSSGDYSDYFAAMNKILKSPIVDSDICNLDWNSSDNNILFQITSDYNTSTYRTFYKDYAELINHTVQFIYYTDSQNIKWTEEFIKRNGFMLDREQESFDDIEFYILPISKEEFSELNPNKYTNEEYLEKWGVDIYNNELPVDNFCSVLFTNYGSPSILIPYINVSWNRNDLQNALFVKLISYNPNTSEFKDIIAFKRANNSVINQAFYVSLNDTRSDKVWAEKDGIIYAKDVIKYNDTDKKVGGN